MKKLFILLLFFPLFLFSKNVSIVDVDEMSALGNLTTIEQNNVIYFDITEFAAAFNSTTKHLKRFKQISLETTEHTILFTAFSPFVKVDAHVYQFPTRVLLQQENFYIPLFPFLEMSEMLFPYKMEYDDEFAEIRLLRSSGQIKNVEVDEKVNGTMIRIMTDGGINPSDVYISQSDGWMYVDLFGGNVDTLAWFPMDKSTKIQRVLPIQLDDTARLSFKTWAEFDEKDVSKSGNDIIVSLRSQVDVQDDILYELEQEREKWKIDTIIIDPGHGGKDPGTIGVSNKYEKYITLAIAKEVQKELERRSNIKVVMTRTSDRLTRIKNRAKLANDKGGKLFISIHADYNPVKRLHGHTIYFLGPAKTEEARQVAATENSVIKYEADQNYEEMSEASFILAANAQNSYNIESEELASIVDQEIKSVCNSNSYGVRQALFRVLYKVSMPNILIETGFLSNSNDEKKLTSSAYQKKLAKAISNAIITFKDRYES